MKTCRLCEEIKPLSDFYTNARNKGGYFHECKVCHSANGRELYLVNKETVNERAKQWARNNPEKAREAARKYRESEKDKKRRKLYYYANLEKKRKYHREWNRNHRDQCRESAKRWRKNNPEKYGLNRKRRYALKKGAEGSYTLEDWDLLLEYYCPDGLCLACGEKREITVDHVVPLISGGTNYLNNTQPLCRNCNSSKREKTIDYRPDGGEYTVVLMGSG